MVGLKAPIWELLDVPHIYIYMAVSHHDGPRLVAGYCNRDPKRDYDLIPPLSPKDAWSFDGFDMKGRPGFPVMGQGPQFITVAWLRLLVYVFREGQGIKFGLQVARNRVCPCGHWIM